MGGHKTFIDGNHVRNTITLVEHNTSSVACHLCEPSPTEHSEQRRQCTTQLLPPLLPPLH